MSHAANIYLVDLAAIQAKIQSAPLVLTELTCESLGEFLCMDPDDIEMDEEDAADEGYPGLIETAQHVLIDGEPDHPGAGDIYYALAENSPGRQLVADPWEWKHYCHVAEHADEYGLSPESTALLRLIPKGTSPFLEPLTQLEDTIVTFLGRDQAIALREELFESEEAENSEDEVFAKTIFNHLLPALDREVPEGHGFAIM